MPLSPTALLAALALGLALNAPASEASPTPDEQGAFVHVLVEGEVHERVELTLSTADPKLAKIHPQNPAATFEIGDRDEVMKFEMKFTRDAKPAARVVRRTGPKQI